jgi:hypothetical protein
VSEEVRVEDQAGQVINDGDLLLDDRGRIWRVLPTENTVRRQQCLRAIEIGGRGSTGTPPLFIRAYDHFLVAADVQGMRERNRRQLYQAKYEQAGVRERNRREFAERRHYVQFWLFTNRIQKGEEDEE